MIFHFQLIRQLLHLTGQFRKNKAPLWPAPRRYGLLLLPSAQNTGAVFESDHCYSIFGALCPFWSSNFVVLNELGISCCLDGWNSFHKCHFLFFEWLNCTDLLFCRRRRICFCLGSNCALERVDNHFPLSVALVPWSRLYLSWPVLSWCQLTSLPIVTFALASVQLRKIQGLHWRFLRLFNDQWRWLNLKLFSSHFNHVGQSLGLNVQPILLIFLLFLYYILDCLIVKWATAQTLGKTALGLEFFMDLHDI